MRARGKQDRAKPLLIRTFVIAWKETIAIGYEYSNLLIARKTMTKEPEKPATRRAHEAQEKGGCRQTRISLTLRGKGGGGENRGF